MEFIEASSKYGGYFSVKTWLYKNFNCESIPELRKRIHAFDEILHHPNNVLIENYMEGACFSEVNPFDQEKCLSSFQKCGITLKKPSSSHIQETGYSLFQQGLKLIEKLLADPEIQKKEAECNFQLYSGQLRKDWTGVGFYQIIQSNHECLSQLKRFYDSIKKNDTEAVKK